MQAPILIVEDEPKIAQILVDFLALDGFDCEVMHEGSGVVERIRQEPPTAVLLDVMLPNKDGLTICREVREFSQVPILMLTARVDEIDRLMGLGIGADDYVCKPFSAREVVARVKTILRRTQPPAETQHHIQYKDIQVDPDKFTCQVNGQLLELTPVEFKLLLAMTKKPGVVFSRDMLMNACYDDNRIVSGRTIDSHMKNLRSKLALHSHTDSLLQSVYGVGYKID